MPLVTLPSLQICWPHYNVMGTLSGVVPRSSARIRRYIFLALLISSAITGLYSLFSYSVLPDRTSGFKSFEVPHCIISVYVKQQHTRGCLLREGIQVVAVGYLMQSNSMYMQMSTNPSVAGQSAYVTPHQRAQKVCVDGYSLVFGRQPAMNPQKTAWHV